MGRIMERRVAARVLGIVVASSLALGSSASRAAPAADPAARVVSVEGSGQYRLDAKGEWKPAPVEQGLDGGNFVRTGEFSRMGLLFRDRTQLRLAEKTVLQVKEGAPGGAGQGTTRLRLEKGRSWTQSKTVPDRLIMETPSAIAAIRGTDWEMQVGEGGAAVLTVLSGEVEFYNDQGRVTVGANEQARAEPGKAPVKMVLVNPRDRVQWVTSYRVDPLRHIVFPADGREAGRKDPELAALESAAALIAEEKFGPASEALAALARGKETRQPAAFLILSDIAASGGDLPKAAKWVEEGLARFPASARLYAQLARIHLLAGRPQEARTAAETALSREPDAVEGQLALGDIAYREGDEGTARRAYTRAAEQDPSEDRAWYGLGTVNTGKEEVKAGRTNLLNALSLDPAGPGYQGQLGTLETFANRFTEGEAAFHEALAQKPDDYVALTGLGILELKRGRTEAALEAFLRAELMEPRYARAQVYKGVAYHQLGRPEAALESFRRAGELDPNDPLPHLLAGIVHSDLSRPDRAIGEAREALRLMPYLKSLNQVANDSQGGANLGRSFALLGMEEWAQSYAQESYFPFWAGSHLFLADRYFGLYDRNSELFQGFLADPTAFGAGNRFSSLIPRPGAYLGASLRGTTSESFDGTSPFLEANGLAVAPFPLAWYLGAEEVALDFADGPYDTRTFTGALGMTPREDWGAFLFADRSALATEVHQDAGGSSFDLEDDLATDRLDLGVHVKLGPSSRLWVKAGSFVSADDASGTIGTSAVFLDVPVDQKEYAFRHSFELGAHQLTWGVETSSRATEPGFYLEESPGSGVFFWLDYNFSEESTEAYIADRFKTGEDLLLDLGLFYSSWERKAKLDYYIWEEGIPPLFVMSETPQTLSGERFSPRLGLVYRFAPTRLVRIAHQRWKRPPSMGSLGPVATAGIPLDDRMVLRGGELTRTRGQVEWELTPRTFAMAFADHEEIDNRMFDPARFTLPFAVNELESLGKLRPRDPMALTRQDLLEFVNTPEYEAGRVTSAGAALNQLLGGGLGVFARCTTFASKNTGASCEGNRLPYLPELAGALGVSWVDPGGWTFVTRFVHRGERYTDEANTVLLQEGWSGSCDLFWESPDKRWLARLAADEMGNPDRDTQYTAEVDVRF